MEPTTAAFLSSFGSSSRNLQCGIKFEHHSKIPSKVDKARSIQRVINIPWYSFSDWLKVLQILMSATSQMFSQYPETVEFKGKTLGSNFLKVDT